MTSKTEMREEMDEGKWKSQCASGLMPKESDHCRLQEFGKLLGYIFRKRENGLKLYDGKKKKII